MKIAVLSDLHLGFNLAKSLLEDSFENAEEAIERACECDLILITGDIFDSRSPKTQVWAYANYLFSKPLLKSSNVKLVYCTKNLSEISKRTLGSIPVIALHGNHDRRAKGEINAVEALEKAGLLIYLNKDTIIFEKDDIKVAIHCMSAVPERFAKAELENWNPRPLENAFNILAIHQNIYPYVYSPLEQPSLNLNNLPKGFDLIVNGHIHSRNEDKIDNTVLINVGSTIVTQLEKSEAESQKGFYEIIFEKDKFYYKFIPLKKARKFYYFETVSDSWDLIKNEIEDKIKRVLEAEDHFKPPLIKFKIKGKEGIINNSDLRILEKKFEGKAVLIFSKVFESEEFSEKIEFLQRLRDERRSFYEEGIHLLGEILKEMNFNFNFDYEQIFHLLSENEIESAISILTGEQKTLLRWKG